jgi:predicted deacylase
MKTSTLSIPHILVLAALSAGAPAVRAQDGPFTVGTATAARGTIAYGEIKVPAGSDAGSTLSVAVVNGAKAGPVVAFVAGSHGTEYASIVALTRLTSRLDPKTLNGTVIIAPLLNVASFEQMTVHTNPIDKKGMNANYPGNPSGTQTERALALVTEQIVKPSSVIVDLHGGDMDEDLRPYSYWIRTGNEAQDKASRALVDAFGLDHSILRDIDVANPASIKSLSGYALAQGKTTIVAEAGRSSLVLPEDVDALIDGSLNVLSSLKMINRPVTKRATPLVFVTTGSRVAAEGAGMFFAKAKRNTIVKEGEVIGETTDYVGRVTGQVKSPATGLITFIRGVPSMWQGATLANVAPVLTTVPAYKKP